MNQGDMSKDFHDIFDMNYYLDPKGLPKYIDGGREGNHVWWVYAFGESYYKATLSWFPHLGYILDDLEIKAVRLAMKKVTYYE